MAEITIDTTRVGMDPVTGMYAAQISKLIAGEAIAKGQACYIKGSDGKAYKASAAADTEAAKVVGLAPDAAEAGEPVSLYAAPSIWDYSTGMTPGTPLYLSQTAAGGFATTQTLVHPSVAFAQVIDANRIRIVRNDSLW